MLVLNSCRGRGLNRGLVSATSVCKAAASSGVNSFCRPSERISPVGRETDFSFPALPQDPGPMARGGEGLLSVNPLAPACVHRIAKLLPDNQKSGLAGNTIVERPVFTRVTGRVTSPRLCQTGWVSQHSNRSVLGIPLILLLLVGETATCSPLAGSARVYGPGRDSCGCYGHMAISKQGYKPSCFRAQSNLW